MLYLAIARYSEAIVTFLHAEVVHACNSACCHVIHNVVKKHYQILFVFSSFVSGKRVVGALELNLLILGTMRSINCALCCQSLNRKEVIGKKLKLSFK